MLNINKISDGTALTVVLEGRLDTSSSSRLNEELHRALDGVTTLVLDLEGLEYISSAGLRVFLFAHKVMKRQGKMTVIHVNDVIHKIFEVTGFIDVLTIEDTASAGQEETAQEGKELTLEAKIDNNGRFTDFVNAELRPWAAP